MRRACIGQAVKLNALEGMKMNLKHLDWWPTYTHAEQFLLAKKFQRLSGWIWQRGDLRVYLRRDVSGVRGRASVGFST